MGETETFVVSVSIETLHEGLGLGLQNFETFEVSVSVSVSKSIEIRDFQKSAAFGTVFLPVFTYLLSADFREVDI